jgi:hypothetical protein
VHGVQAVRLGPDAGDNILARLGKQAVTRVLPKKAVPVMIARLCPRFPFASSRSLLTRIVQVLVVEHNIGGIGNRDEYNALRNASVEAEGAFIAQLQATLQKNIGALRKSVRDLVAAFVEEETECILISYVKEHVFSMEGRLPLVPKTHHILAKCFEIPCPPLKGTLLCSLLCGRTFPPPLTSADSPGRARTWTLFESAASLSMNRITCLDNMGQPCQKSIAHFLG